MLDTVIENLQRVRQRRRTAKLRLRERKELPVVFPELVRFREELHALQNEYRDLHTAYTRSVSDALNAISLSQVALLAWLVRTRPLKRVLDTGSGFSSLVLRREAQRKPGLAHFAVEDNAYWLDRTTDFLSQQKLPAENVLSWEAFQADKSLKDFDLVYHDMGNMTTRILSLLELEPRLAPDGWLILDDMHKASYHPHAVRHLGQRWIVQSLVDLTLDDSGRYACICRRKP